MTLHNGLWTLTLAQKAALWTIARFLLAYILGSLMAAVITFASGPPEEFSLFFLLMFALMFGLFALLPTLVFGIPALMLLRRLNLPRPLAASAMMVGGAAVGAGLMGSLFTIPGGSIWLMLGLVFHPIREMSGSANSH